MLNAGLIDVDNELVVEPPPQHLIARARDGGAESARQAPHGHVGVRRRLLDQRHGPHHPLMETQPADGEILNRAVCLDAVIRP